MKIVYLKWGYLYDDYIVDAFREENILVNIISISESIFLHKREDNNEVYEFFKNKICGSNGDIIFSVNFSSFISDLCQENKIPYCSWILDLPNVDLYTQAVFNSCNYIGICDSYILKKLYQSNKTKIFYLPDAVKARPVDEDKQIEREMCFISRQPNAFLDMENMSLYSRGYLDAFIQCQRVLHDEYILETGLINRVYNEFKVGKNLPLGILPIFEKLYLMDTYIAPICTVKQQNIFLKSNEDIMTIYSNGEYELCNCKKFDYLESEEDRRNIYSEKEFSLIMAPHVLHNAIPRDFFEVIDSGGFPICAYQKDYDLFFENHKNIVYFKNQREFVHAIMKYGNNREELYKIKEAAYQIVKKNHTYKSRIITMLEYWTKL